MAPLFHVGGISSCHVSLLVGGTQLFLSNPKFIAKNFIKLLINVRVTSLITVPTIMRDLVEIAWPSLSFSYMLHVLIGAGGVSRKLKNVIVRLFPLANLTETYGMSECCSSIVFHHKKEPASLCAYGKHEIEPCNQAGSPTTGISLLFLSAKTHNATVGTEIYIKGPVVLIGYFFKSNRGSELRRDGKITRDCWLCTDDLGRFEFDSLSTACLVLLGRSKDIIKPGGENVHIGILDRALRNFLNHENISIFGLKDLRLGEAIGVVISTYLPINLYRDKVIEFLKEIHVTGIKTPQIIFFAPKFIPRNEIGKISKKVLIDAACSLFTCEF